MRRGSAAADFHKNRGEAAIFVKIGLPTIRVERTRQTLPTNLQSASPTLGAKRPRSWLRIVSELAAFGVAVRRGSSHDHTKRATHLQPLWARCECGMRTSAGVWRYLTRFTGQDPAAKGVFLGALAVDTGHVTSVAGT